MLDAETHNKITLQSTSLIRGKTGTEGQWKEVTDHFNPLPSSEGRRYSPQSPSHGSHFNPLPSSEGRLRYPHSKNESFILQSTSLIRGKTDQIFRIGVGLFTSIHFPHPREDSSMLQGVYGFETSIHFPHPREDSGQKRNLLVQRHFNPLPSSEGRPHKGGGKRWREYFNPLPSSEGRQQMFVIGGNYMELQSTSLIRGKTWPEPTYFKEHEPLQSTSLIRGKTQEIIISQKLERSLQSTSLIRGKTAKLPDSFLKSKYIFSTFIQFHLLSL